MSARSLGTLTLDLVARIGGFTKGLTEAERASDKATRQIERQNRERAKAIQMVWNDATRYTITAFGALATAGAAAFAVLNRQTENIAGFQGLAEKIGDTAEAVASLKLASGVSGVSLDTVGAASIRLTASLSKTDDESKGVAQAIKALGLNFQEFKNLAPVDQIDSVAKAMGDFADGSEKTAVAVALFGKAGAELIPFLNDLASGSERQITLTNEQIKQADDYSKAQARLRSEFETFIQFQTAQAIPTLTAVQEVFAEIAKNETTVAVVTETVGAAMKAAIVVFQTLAVVGSDVGFVFLSVGREIGAWAAQLVALGRGDLAGFRAISDAVKADGERARAELDKFQKSVMQIGQTPYMDDEIRRLQNRSAAANAPAGRPRLSTAGLVTGGGSDKAAKEAADAAKAAQAYLENLRKQLQATEDLTVAETVRRDIEAGRVKLAGGVTKQQLVDLAMQIDMDKELAKIAEQFKKLEEESLERKKALADAGKAIYDATRTPAEQLNVELTKLNDLLAKGAIDWDTYGRAVFDAQDKFEAAANGAKDALSEWDEFKKTAIENTQGALADSLFKGMRGEFDSVLGGFTEMLQRMVAEALAADLARKIFGSSVKGGQGDGWLGAAMNWAGSFFGGRAAGGAVTAGGMYRVNENGPEMLEMNGQSYLMMGDRGGNVRQGTGTNVVNNFSVSGPVDRRTEAQIGRAATRGVQRAQRWM